MLDYRKMKDVEIRDLMFTRNMEAPLDEDNKLIRKMAIEMLKRWDNENVQRPRRNVRVVFHRTGNNSSSYLFGSYNGKAYQIPFEKEVLLPEEVLLTCFTAKSTVTRMIDGAVDENGRQRFVDSDVSPYPFSIMGYEDVEPSLTEQAFED